MPKPKTLAWYLADLAERRVEYTKRLNEPALTDEERAHWQKQVQQVEIILADMAADPDGWMAFLAAADNAALLEKLGRFNQ